MVSIWDYLASLEEQKKQPRERLRLGAPPTPVVKPFDPFNPTDDEAPYFETFPVGKELESPFDPFNEIAKTRPRVVGGLQDDLTTRPRIADTHANGNRPELTTPVNPLTEKEDRLKLLYNSPVENNDKGVGGRVGDVLRQAVISAGEAYKENLRAGMNPKEALIAAGGGAVAGGLYGGLRPEADEERQRLFDINKTQTEIAGLQQQQQFQSQQEMAKAQLEDVPLEREYKKDILQERKDARIAKQKETARNNFYKQNKFFSKKNATEAQKRQLAEFGETPDSIGEFDFTNPTFKKIGDSIFRWDKNENAFVDSGLPKDSSAAFTEITAVDPTDGKTYTYITTQEKAAGLLNSKVVGNMQIIAARDRQASQQSFQAQENEKNREVRREAIQVSRDRLSIANRNVELAEQRLALAQDKDKRAAQEELRKAKETRFRLKAYLKNNPLISGDDDLNNELNTLEDEQ